MTKEQINEKVKKAKNAFCEWKKDIQKRAEYLYDVAHVFRQDKERLAKVITNEMGKAIKEARSEVGKMCLGYGILCRQRKSFCNRLYQLT